MGEFTFINLILDIISAIIGFKIGWMVGERMKDIW